MTTIQTSSHHFNPQLEGIGSAFVIRTRSVKHKTLFEKPSSPTLYPPLERAKNPSISNSTPQQTRKTLPNPVLKLELGKLSQTLKPEVKSSALKPVKEERSSPVTNSSPVKDSAALFNKIDNFVIARLLEEAKERDSLATILKVENNPVLKMDNSMLPMEKEVQNKVFDKIQKTFQKKETNSPTFMPSVRQSNGNKQKQSETGSKAISPRLMNGQMLATASSPLHKRGLLTNLNNYKKPLQFGFLSSRGDGRYGNESSFSPFKTSRGPNQLPETKSINSGYRIVNQTNDKSGWNSERSPMSSRLLTQRGSEQQQPPFRGFIDEVKKSRIFKRIEGSLPVKISAESREKLHRIIHGDNFDGQDDDYHMTTQTSVVRSHDGRRLSNEEVIKNDLNAAIAEYENDFHARFNKTRRTRGQVSDYQVKQKVEKVEKVDAKWAGEMPHRRAFAIANPADPNQEFLDPLHDRRRANFSKKTKPKQDDKVASTVDGKQKNNNKIDADLLADKYCGEKARFRRIRAALKDRLIKCADLKITIKDIIKDKSIFPKNPYEKEGAELFIKAAKTGDYNYVYNILKTNRYYVNEFDPTKQTALHWAAKRGNKEVCRVLLDYCADPDAANLGGRTPLYYALKGKHSEIVRLLLCAKANPWTFAKTNYKTVCRDTRSQIYITKARQISLLLKFQSPKDRQGVWEKEIRVGLAPIPSYDEDQS